MKYSFSLALSTLSICSLVAVLFFVSAPLVTLAQDAAPTSASAPIPPEGNGTTSYSNMMPPERREEMYQQREERGMIRRGDSSQEGMVGQDDQGDRHNEEFTKRQKEQAARMAKNFEKMQKQFEKRSAKLASQGISLSTECKSTLSTLSAAIAKMKGEVDEDELMDLQESIQESSEDLRECQMQLEQLSNVAKIFKTAKKMLAKMKKVGADPALETTFIQLTKDFDKVKAGVTSDEIDLFFEQMEEFGDMMREEQQKIDQKRRAMEDQSGSVFVSIKRLFGF